jgi:hypothetical protein
MKRTPVPETSGHGPVETENPPSYPGCSVTGRISAPCSRELADLAGCDFDTFPSLLPKQG